MSARLRETRFARAMRLAALPVAALIATLGANIKRRHKDQADAALHLYLHAPGRLQPRPALDQVALCELPVPDEAAHDVLCCMSRAVV